MSQYRYINNTDTAVVSGLFVVPAYDQLILREEVPEFAGTTLVILVDGVQVSAEAPVVAIVGTSVPEVLSEPEVTEPEEE